ncbi:MAG: hypothetical protein ACT4O9_13495 [Blastocatellia bacterium]
MFNRFRRIRIEFGKIMFARTILLLAIIVGISVFGLVGFTSPWPTFVAIVGLAVGVLFRRAIVDSFEILSWTLPAGLFVYGVVLFIGDRLLGMSGELQLLIITVTTVAVFDIQFWALSDPSIVNTENND